MNVDFERKFCENFWLGNLKCYADEIYHDCVPWWGVSLGAKLRCNSKSIKGSKGKTC